MQICYIEFHPNRTVNVESMNTTSSTLIYIQWSGFFPRSIQQLSCIMLRAPIFTPPSKQYDCQRPGFHVTHSCFTAFLKELLYEIS